MVAIFSWRSSMIFRSEERRVGKECSCLKPMKVKTTDPFVLYSVFFEFVLWKHSFFISFQGAKLQKNYAIAKSMDIDLETGDLKLYPVKPRIILLQNFKWTRNEVSIVFSFGFVGIMYVSDN